MLSETCNVIFTRHLCSVIREEIITQERSDPNLTNPGYITQEVPVSNARTSVVNLKPEITDSSREHRRRLCKDRASNPSSYRDHTTKSGKKIKIPSSGLGSDPPDIDPG